MGEGRASPPAVAALTSNGKQPALNWQVPGASGYQEFWSGSISLSAKTGWIFHPKNTISNSTKTQIVVMTAGITCWVMRRTILPLEASVQSGHSMAEDDRRIVSIDRISFVIRQGNYSPQSAYREHRDMLSKKQITAKNAKHTKENRGFFLAFLAFLAVTIQFMGAMSDEGKQLPGRLIKISGARGSALTSYVRSELDPGASSNQTRGHRTEKAAKE